MKIIVAVTYQKDTGEFKIKERDTETGRASVTFANHLTENERIFCKSRKSKYEDRFIVQWC
jgi:hypothetical protein